MRIIFMLCNSLCRVLALLFLYIFEILYTIGEDDIYPYSEEIISHYY